MKQVFLTFLIFACYFTNAQFFGKTSKAHNQKIIPFVHYIIDDTLHGISNFEGIFKIEAKNFSKISFYHPLYSRVSITNSVLRKNDTINLLFIPQKKLDFIEKTDSISNTIIKQVIKHRNLNHPKKHAPYYYETYNKFSIETNQISETKNLIDKYLKYITPKKIIKEFDSDHHLVISESTSKTRYLTPLHEDEFITASKVSGVKTPLLVTANSKLQSIHLYDKFIRIGSKNYVNPIQDGSLTRYHFEFLDSIPSKHGTLYVLSFFPKKSAKFESLKGLLYICPKQYAVQYAVINPVIESITTTTYLTESQWMEKHNCWFPKRSFAQIETNELTLENIKLTTLSHSVIHNVVLDTSFYKNDFTEIYMDYDTISYPIDYWKKERQLSLCEKDKNTYIFYDSVGSLNNLDRIINLGERIQMKQIPYKYIYVNLPDVIDYNNYEGLRLGLGITTNQKFSKTYELSSYFGYGFKDKAFKYGASAKYHLKTRLPSFFYAHYQHDVEESGNYEFSYNHKAQFSSEWLRNLKISVMDLQIKKGIGLQVQPHKYLYLLGEFNSFETTPLYTYQFEEETTNTFNYQSFKVGIKYAFGEQFFRLLHEKISFGSLYPSFWINYEQGVSTLPFHKIYSKMEYRHHFINGGISTIQFVGGAMTGNVPYFLLFNGKGSQGVRTVAHNSFETMGYNEFLSSDFINIFYSHDFGYWNFFNNRYFRPRLEVAINGGWGQLSNKPSHKNIDFKTMEHGFVETGFLMNNLLTLRIYSLKIGLGLGYYMRLGAYAEQNLKDDSYIKISTNFNL